MVRGTYLQLRVQRVTQDQRVQQVPVLPEQSVRRVRPAIQEQQVPRVQSARRVLQVRQVLQARQV
jgi:hypothetical protein